MYLVELTQVNGLVKVKRRSEDYDIVRSTFDRLKKTMLRELRMFRVQDDGDRVLLKTFTRGRANGSAK